MRRNKRRKSKALQQQFQERKEQQSLHANLERTAFHEAGHAVLRWVIRQSDPDLLRPQGDMTVKPEYVRDEAGRVTHIGHGFTAGRGALLRVDDFANAYPAQVPINLVERRAVDKRIIRGWAQRHRTPAR